MEEKITMLKRWVKFYEKTAVKFRSMEKMWQMADSFAQSATTLNEVIKKL